MTFVFTCFALLLTWCGVAAQAAAPIPEASLQCRQAVAMAERAAGVPPRLMAAIARVESGRADGQGGVHPWPWTINVEGAGYVYASKAEAIAAVRGFQARGARSIDVGCMQVNLMYHPAAFASQDEAFDPMANARYAAKFLGELFGQARDWTKATAMYHSATPALGETYQRKVLALLTDEERRGLVVSGMPGGGLVMCGRALCGRRMSGIRARRRRGRAGLRGWHRFRRRGDINCRIGRRRHG